MWVLIGICYINLDKILFIENSEKDSRTIIRFTNYSLDVGLPFDEVVNIISAKIKSRK